MIDEETCSSPVSDTRIGVVINTYNAAADLPRCIGALKGFDDILVVDMESTDGTPELARSLGARVETFPRGENNVCEVARDFAIRHSACRWVLVVDADEVVTPQLRDYLYSRIADNPPFAALSLPFQNYFMGRRAHNGHAERHPRFMLRDRTVWPPYVHSIPRVDGVIEKVPDRPELRIQHHNDIPIAALMVKNNQYSDNEVKRKITRRFNYFSLLVRPVWFFFRTYFLKGGILDGRRGLIRSYMAMFYHVALMAKVIERQENGK